ncbi:hypothetical protein [Metabacillus halosaccharovorans]|uniref:hypothetical protein n=1 Tax=Metabacillus halosaccharovorans TaxID=930124 RepID=UPI0020422F4F|nr:hypothetical protein [Metabacillus halosaccharovorans]MCM3443781.1 hypothetical protein [Metabacillus halosaccharovorans]
MIQVYLETPKIEYDTVYFEWNISKPLPYLKKNNFYIKYENIDLTCLPLDVFWNGILGIMIPILKISQEEVMLIFPEPVSSRVAETWINYHNAEGITIVPLIDKQPFTLPDGYVSNEKYDAGILFGGGKDSSYALSVISEIYNLSKTLLISYVFPLDTGLIDEIHKRRDNLMLEPMKKDLGVKVQKIITDFRTTLKNQETSNKIHIELYSSTILPVLLKYQFSLLSFSYEFNLYWNRYYDSNQIRFNFLRSRPEYNEYISERTNSVFHTNLQLRNFNYYISEIAGFKVLVNRYPEMLKYLLMCESTTDPTKKWCHRCHKCAEYVLYSLYFQYEQKEIDVDEFFTSSHYITKALKDSENLPILESENGNFAWTSSIFSRAHFQSYCHIIASIDVESVKEKTSEQGFNNFMELRNRYGNKKYPYQEAYILPAFNDSKLAKADLIENIIKQYCYELPDSPEYLYSGDTKVSIDYEIRSEIPNIYRNDLFNLGKLLKQGYLEQVYLGLPLEKGKLSSGNFSNSEKEVPINSTFKHNTLEYYIDLVNPKKEDYVEWSYIFKVDKEKGNHITIHVTNPFINPSLRGRLEYRISINNKVLIKEDIAFWKDQNIINIYLTKGYEQIKLSVQVCALKNCEPWKFGYAGRLFLSNLSLKECNVEKEIVTTTSPYSQFAENENNIQKPGQKTEEQEIKQPKVELDNQKEKSSIQKKEKQSWFNKLLNK